MTQTAIVAPPAQAESDIPIVVDVTTQDSHTIYRIDPNALYDTIRRTIDGFMSGGASLNPEAARTAALVRVAVKGVLLAYGDKILDSLFGGKNHDKPGRGDDLITWYTNMFTRIAIAMLMKNETYLSGHVLSEDITDEFQESIIQINEVRTKSNT